jgi:cystathionine beta-lyase/cystathionine gamma-synthase
MHPDAEPGTPHAVATRLAHFGEDVKVAGAVVHPIFQNSLFVFDRTQDLLNALEVDPFGPPHHYSRISNPTVDLLERKLADLEGTEAAKVVGCGMAAITAAIMSCLSSGGHVVCPDTAYGPVRNLLNTYLDRFDISVTYVSGRDTDEIIAATRSNTQLIYLESPSSALFRMQDIPAITAFAKSRGIRTVIDNTYASPLLMNPHALGVDLVCHSATKYIGGHSDVTAGVICGTEQDIRRIGLRDTNFMGNILHPFPAWLLMRGLRTLGVRLPVHTHNAQVLAEFLEAQPDVDVVHHLGLASYPQRDLVTKLMRGTGGLFSFEPKNQTKDAVLAFCDGLKLFQRGISWGGFESLVVPIRVTPADYPEPKWVIRLFCGLEDAEDLRRDVEQALPALAA